METTALIFMSTPVSGWRESLLKLRRVGWKSLQVVARPAQSRRTGSPLPTPVGTLRGQLSSAHVITTTIGSTAEIRSCVPLSPTLFPYNGMNIPAGWHNVGLANKSRTTRSKCMKYALCHTGTLPLAVHRSWRCAVSSTLSERKQAPLSLEGALHRDVSQCAEPDDKSQRLGSMGQAMPECGHVVLWKTGRPVDSRRMIEFSSQVQGHAADPIGYRAASGHCTVQHSDGSERGVWIRGRKLTDDIVT
jgi:hypothetical protein